MATHLSTPYYLSGEQKRSWHTNQAEKAFFTGAVAAGAAHALSHGHAPRGVRIALAAKHVSPKQAHTALLVGAGASAAYGGYHGVRAFRYHQKQNQRRDRALNRKGN